MYCTPGEQQYSFDINSNYNKFVLTGQVSGGTYNFSVIVNPFGLAIMNSTNTLTYNMSVDSINPTSSGVDGKKPI